MEYSFSSKNDILTLPTLQYTITYWCLSYVYDLSIWTSVNKHIIDSFRVDFRNLSATLIAIEIF